MEEFIAELKRVVSVETGEACSAFALDGSIPSVVIQPASADEVCAALKVCNEHAVPGVVWGGGTHVGIGTPLQRYGWAMELRRLSHLVDYSPEDLVVTVEAGMSLQELQSLLQPYGHWLPVDAPLPSVQTVGGIVATGRGGLKQLRYGLPREWLLAVRVALPSGEMIKGGVGVVKNVAGYDLPRLFAGSWGTLGVLLQVTFKVASLPEVSIAYQCSFTQPEALLDLRDALSNPLLQAEMLEVVYQPGAPWRLYCGLAGFEEDVRWQFNLLTECTRREWTAVASEDIDDLRDRCLRIDAACRCRCVVPPVQTAHLLQWAAKRFPGAELQAHFGSGVVFVWWRENVPELRTLGELREEARGCGGYCVIEHAPAEVKSTLGVWDTVRGGSRVMQRLKEAFDPCSILAPGRFVEGI